MGATSLALFETAITAAATAIEADDYAEARKQYTKAQVLYKAIPEQSQTDSTKTQYNDIDFNMKLIDDLEAAANRVNDRRRFVTPRTGF